MTENLTEKVVEKLRIRYKDDLLLDQFSWPLEGSAYGHADAIGISLIYRYVLKGKEESEC